MALVGNTYLTLADLHKRTDGNKQTAAIIELLAETNPILQDMVVTECNDGTSHLTTVRTGIPEGTWRMLYQGVQPTKSTTAQVRDTCGMLEAWSEVDSKLVELSNDPAGLRMSEAAAFLEGMNQQMTSTLFYGDQVNSPARFTGLAPRFNTLSGTIGQQVVDMSDGYAKGSDNTSIWFVVWGDRTVSGLYPKGSKAGLTRDDKGKQTKVNADGSVYDVHREKFSWDLGLSVRDYRYVVRIANIDTKRFGESEFSKELYKHLKSAYYKLHNRIVTGGKAAIYMNVDILEQIDLGLNDGGYSSALRVTPADAEGKEVLNYRGIPIRQCDAILNTEAAVI